jgi:prepilin-type N-terminal cleavage/methylation domain-containing protein
LQLAVQNKKGFTLIELLVVMAIIAILAVAMSVAFLRTSQSARDTTRKDDVRNIATKCEEYFKDHGSYPAALSDLVTGGYISSLPTDPKSKAAYTYTPSGTPPTTFTLSSSLENTNDSAYPTFTVSNAQ